MLVSASAQDVQDTSNSRGSRGSHRTQLASRVLLALSVIVVTLTAQAASAQIACRCALRGLDELVCDNDLTARVRVLWGLSLANGDRLYGARVQQTFRGETAPEILIEVPESCGLPLRARTSYAVSVSRDDNGIYSTFACNSFAKVWNQVTRAELSTLREPQCAPTCDDVTCEPSQHCELQTIFCIRAPCPPAVPTCVRDTAAPGELCYQFDETGNLPFIDRPCDSEHKCASTSARAGFNTSRSCVPLDYCVDENSAGSDCEDLIHPAVLGRWSCIDHSCSWRAGNPESASDDAGVSDQDAG